ncbi:meiosis initiator protein [Eulemur rufifrons]|uniref:meiosis initiator protein n=1 Tax=Eulemur rufifrons TaxID=859984 RepID=UPI0037422CAC
MWDSSRDLCSPEQPRASSLSPNDSAKFNFGCPNQNQLLSPNRKQRKNHTSQLQELALLLPVALKTGNKKLTKKEILLHVLHYIQYLQRSIDVAKALLKFHTSAGEDGLAGLGRNPARRRHSTPSSSPCCRKSRLQGACQKPRKKKLTRVPERQTRTQKPRRSLALDKPEKLVTPDQKGGNMGGTAPAPRSPDSCSHPEAASSSSQGGRNGGQSHLTFLDMAESIVHCDILSCCCGNSIYDNGPYPPLGEQEGAESIHFLSKTQPCSGQKLLLYNSSEEVDKKSLDADPWLPVWTLQDSPHGSPLPLGPPKIDTWSVTGNPIEILGLNPSVFSSPGKLLPEQILEDGAEYLTEDLFEEVYLYPESPASARLPAASQKKDVPLEALEDPPDSHSLCQSLVSADHCYLSLSENSKAPSSSSSEDSDTESMWTQQEDMCANPQGLQTSSDEDGDYTWTPTRRASTLPAAGRKARKGRAGRGPVKPKESKKASCPTQTKKKCVNGFIMFCRMNRKQYIRACPGTASTAATKELAQLWRVMTQQERRPYCTKARRFSRQHNRIVKQENSSSDDDDWETPKPFYQLLAEKARCASDAASLPPPSTGERGK